MFQPKKQGISGLTPYSFWLIHQQYRSGRLHASGIAYGDSPGHPIFKIILEGDVFQEEVSFCKNGSTIGHGCGILECHVFDGKIVAGQEFENP